MAEDTKENFIFHESVQKPLKELEDLNAQVKKKKQEVKKALFYAKHPTLKQAKEEYHEKLTEQAKEKFAESVKEPEEPVRPVKDPVRQEVTPNVRKTSPAPTPAPAPAPVERPKEPEVPKPAPAPAPAPVKPKTLVVPVGGSWF